MTCSPARCVYAVLDRSQGLTKLVGDALSLFSETISLTAVYPLPRVVLELVRQMDLTTNLGVLGWADQVNSLTRDDVNVVTGSDSGATWLCHRIFTSNRKFEAEIRVDISWHDGNVAVRLNGHPDAMKLCTVDCLWIATVDGTHCALYEPLRLQDAIARSTDLN